MKQNPVDIEKMLSKCELEPKEELKSQILREASLIVAENNEKKRSFTEIFSSKKWRFALACCCFVLILGVGSVFGLINEDYMQVYVDVNPSIAMSVNRFDKVVKVDSLNEDARELLKNEDFKGMKAEEATEQILNLLGNKGYLKDSALFITTECKNEERGKTMQEKLASGFERYKSENKYTVDIYKGSFSKDEKLEAKHFGMSPVKYHLISEIMRKDSSYRMEDLKDKRMKELNDLLRDLFLKRAETENPSKEDYKDYFEEYMDWWEDFTDSEHHRPKKHFPKFPDFFSDLHEWLDS